MVKSAETFSRTRQIGAETLSSNGARVPQADPRESDLDSSSFETSGLRTTTSRGDVATGCGTSKRLQTQSWRAWQVTVDRPLPAWYQFGWWARRNEWGRRIMRRERWCASSRSPRIDDSNSSINHCDRRRIHLTGKAGLNGSRGLLRSSDPVWFLMTLGRVFT